MPENPIVLLTRPATDSERFAKLLEESAKVLISPVFEVRQIGVDVNPDDYGAFVFSSQNAIRSIANTKDLKGRKAYTVGDRTADIAKTFGMDAVSAGGNADDLVTAIIDAAPTEKVLHLRGSHTRGSIRERLNIAGIETDSAVVYEQVPKPLSAEATRVLAGQHTVLVPVFSPRSSELLSAALRGVTVNAPLKIIAMSDAVSQAWDGPEPAAIIVVAKPTAKDMLKETLRSLC